MLSCNSQGKKTKKMEQNSNIEKNDNTRSGINTRDSIMMTNNKLDIKTLEEKGNSVETNIPVEEGWKTVNSYSYETVLDDQLHVYITGNSVTGYTKSVKANGNYFKTVYGYYPNGTIKLKGTFYRNNDFKKGIWSYYKEDGKIDKEEDFDKPFLFTWNDILKFLKENKIEEKDIYFIRRSIEEDKPFWYVGQVTKRGIEPEEAKIYTLDGNTGAIIEKEVMDITRNLGGVPKQ